MREKLIKYVMRLGVKDLHDAETIVNDVLLDERAVGYEFRKAKLLAYNYFDTSRKRKEVDISVYLDDTVTINDSEVSNYDIIPFEDLNKKHTDLQESQRQLINDLVAGTDERTTLIVQTFLECDKPTVTNVAKQLGLDHKQVSRALTRLSRKYSESKYGDLSDYLSA